MINLEVGKKYINRVGDVAEIVYVDVITGYFLGVYSMCDTIWYTKDGIRPPQFAIEGTYLSFELYKEFNEPQNAQTHSIHL